MNRNKSTINHKLRKTWICPGMCVHCRPSSPRVLVSLLAFIDQCHCDILFNPAMDRARRFDTSDSSLAGFTLE